MSAASELIQGSYPSCTSITSTLSGLCTSKALNSSARGCQRLHRIICRCPPHSPGRKAVQSSSLKGFHRQHRYLSISDHSVPRCVRTLRRHLLPSDKTGESSQSGEDEIVNHLRPLQI